MYKRQGMTDRNFIKEKKNWSFGKLFRAYGMIAARLTEKLVSISFRHVVQEMTGLLEQ